MITQDTGVGGLPRLTIRNDLAEAEVYLLGATVTHWKPRDHAPVLWTGPADLYQAGKPIRGGIPLCLPWFGPHADPTKPAHGFVRTRPWTVERTADLPDGRSRVKLSFTTDAETRAIWPHDLRVGLTVTVGRTLDLELTITNTGSETVLIGEALHTYFAVEDIRRTIVHGLAGTLYVDKVAGGRHRQCGDGIAFTGETDRVYLSAHDDCTIDDEVGGRRIHVKKSGSGATVVWNPWIAKSAKMADFGADQWMKMVCVESANALDSVYALPPAFSHHLRCEISVEGG